MNAYAIKHLPQSSSDAFAVTGDTVVIRIRTAKSDALAVSVVLGCKYNWVSARVYPMDMAFTDELYDIWELKTRVADTRLNYYFKINFRSGETKIFSENGLSDTTASGNGLEDINKAPFFQMPYINEGDYLPLIDWTTSAVAYQIFPDRFYTRQPKLRWGKPPTGFDFFGGDLNGAAEKIPYLADLGVNLIYFTPVTCSDSNHRYDIFDYEHIDPMLGGDDAFKKFVAKAHANGMRVMCDGVFNHTSPKFHAFADVTKLGKKSKYYDWYFIDGDKPVHNPLNFKSFGFYGGMPKLNAANKEVEDFIVRITTDFVKRFDIDGWRFDVADEVAQTAWRTVRRALKSTKKDLLIIGEDWHDPSHYLNGDMFDGVMNYGFWRAATDYFTAEFKSADLLKNRLTDMLLRCNDNANHMMFNLLDSHDTARFMTVIGGDRQLMKSALALMFFIPGIPMICYGDETGMQGGNDPDCRRCFDWSQESITCDIHEHVKMLVNLKKTTALNGGNIRLFSDSNSIVIDRFDDKSKISLTIKNGEFSIK